MSADLNRAVIPAQRTAPGLSPSQGMARRMTKSGCV